MQTPSNKSERGPIIGLLGHTGNRNMGDEAITEAVISNLSARIPGVRFKLFTINPQDSQERYDCPAYPLRPTGDANVSSSLYRYWQPAKQESIPTNGSLLPLHERKGWFYTRVTWKPRLKQRIGSALRVGLQLPAIVRNELMFDRENLKLLEDIDLLIFTGSNQFLDNFGGPWAFPYTLMRWSRLAAKSNTPIAFASVGAGPIYSKLSLRLIRRALRNAAYVSVRDAPSKKLLVDAGCKSSIAVCPDLAFSLPEDKMNDQPARNQERPVIGINPMPVYASYYWYVSDTGLYSNYIDALTNFALWLKNNDYPFFFFATQTRDQNVIDEILEGMAQNSDDTIDTSELVRHSNTVSELDEIVKSADVVVATRFHGSVLGLFRKKLVIGTCYYRKAADLLSEFGLGNYVLQLEDVTAKQIIEKFEDLVLHQNTLQLAIDQTQHRYRQELDQQYDRLCALLTSTEKYKTWAGSELQTST